MNNTAQNLLHWYQAHQRHLPWRSQNPPAYHVLVSEFMLQQTTVATVLKRFDSFIAHFPTILDLATATEAEILAAWAGLGYYTRARNLHKAARVIAAEFGGNIPLVPDVLQKIPGIGAYTAAAVAAIAGNYPIIPVDANIARITKRYHGQPAAEKITPRWLAEKAQQFLIDGHAGEIAQALMDVGSTFCTAKRMDCHSCPLQSGCRAKGREKEFLTPIEAVPRTNLYADCFIIENKRGELLTTTMPAKGIYAGTKAFPLSQWQAQPVAAISPPALLANISSNWQIMGEISHVLTHRLLQVRVLRGYWHQDPPADQQPTEYGWHTPDIIASMPSLMKKIYKIVNLAVNH
ncbi:MAG: A/G-specific adenine glycosylase [Alphaproteobacteria bacterium]